MLHEVALRYIIRPSLALIWNEFGIPATALSERLLLAIALQESRLEHRVQMGNGPARGLWQFEQGGGVLGVLRHPASKPQAEQLCHMLLVEPTTAAVHRAIEHNDLLACGFARLLLWTDPRALPLTAEDGWAYYLRNWRPGKPHPDTWLRHWLTAGAAL